MLTQKHPTKSPNKRFYTLILDLLYIYSITSFQVSEFTAFHATESMHLVYKHFLCVAIEF